jgi:uncharacterized membrane protein YgdD (TMEM256/DUF423 family)
MPSLRTISSVLGASGIGLGAFGAHGLKDRLSAQNKLDNWKTAVMYQLFHAVAILCISALCENHQQATSNKKDHRRTDGLASLERAGHFMAIGTALFSGSIYLLCLEIGYKKILGPTTPLGGLMMIAGWAMLGFHHW